MRMRRSLLLVGVLLACLGAGSCARSRHAFDIPVASACVGLDPYANPILWWWYDCGKTCSDCAGGGGSGAS